MLAQLGLERVRCIRWEEVVVFGHVTLDRGLDVAVVGLTVTLRETRRTVRRRRSRSGRWAASRNVSMPPMQNPITPMPSLVVASWSAR